MILGAEAFEIPFMYILEEPIYAKHVAFIPNVISGNMIGNRFGIFGCTSNKSKEQVKGMYDLFCDVNCSVVTIINITIIAIQMDHDNHYRRHSIYRDVS